MAVERSCWKFLDHICEGLLLGCLLCSLVGGVSLCRNHAGAMTVALGGRLWNQCESSDFVLFQDCFAYSRFLVFPCECWGQLVSLLRSWGLMRVTRTLQTSLESISSSLPLSGQSAPGASFPLAASWGPGACRPGAPSRGAALL